MLVIRHFVNEFDDKCANKKDKFQTRIICCVLTWTCHRLHLFTMCTSVNDVYEICNSESNDCFHSLSVRSVGYFDYLIIVPSYLVDIHVEKNVL